MIIDNLNNAPKYYALGEKLTRGLVFLQETELLDLQAGRHEILGDDCYAMVSEYDTLPASEGVWEAHRKYLDIQYLVSGAEKIGYANINSLEVAEDYNESGDYLLLKGNGDIITLPAGSFAIFYPEDAHMPCLQADGKQHVKKVVVKVRL